MYRRLSDMRARDILQNRSCPLVKGAQSIMKAIDEMEDCGLGAVGVESEHKFVGIFTRSDFMKKVLRRNINPKTTPLFEVMTFNPIVISSRETLKNAQKMMLAFKIRHLPVLDGGIFKGILTEEDINIGLLENYENITEEYNNILSYIHGESYGRCAY